MTGQHPLADLAPRDVVAKAIMREMIAAGTDHVYLDGRHLGAAGVGAQVPDDPGELPRARHRPGHRPDPGRAGRALRQRRRPHRPVRPDQRARPVRLRRGGLHRRARRQPAGVQLAAGRPGLRRADRGGPGPRPAAAAPRPGGPSQRDRGCLDPAIVRPAAAADVGERRRPSGPERGWLRPRRAWPTSAGSSATSPTPTRGRPPTCTWSPPRWSQAALAREETRGSHWREDFAEPSEAWRGHLISRWASPG